LPVRLSGIAKIESGIKILEALKEGPKTWSQLASKTRLSKRTLQLRLPEMEERGVIRRTLVAKPGQRSRVLYVLSEKGNREIPILGNELIKGITETYQLIVRSLKGAGEAFINLVLGKEYENCVSFNISHKEQIRNEEELKDHVRTALSYLLSQYVDRPEELEEITGTDFTLTFRFDRSAVMTILQEKEAEKTKEPIRTRPILSPEEFMKKWEDQKEPP